MAEETTNEITWRDGDIPAAEAEAKFGERLTALTQGGASLEQAVVTINATAIAKVLRDLGCETAVEISYEGSGDSGNGEEFSDFPEPEEGWAGVEVLCVDQRGGYGSVPLQTIAMVRVDKDLEVAMGRLCDQVIEANNCGGWENGEGGRGEVTLAMDGAVTHTHYDYVVDTLQRGTWTLGPAA